MKLVYIGTAALQQDITDALSRTRGGHDVLAVTTKEDFTRVLENRIADILLFDYCAAPETLPLSQVLIYARALKAPVVALTSTSIDTPIDDLQSAGISSYLFREHLNQLPFIIGSMAETMDLERETQDLYQALERTGHYYQTLLKSIDDFVFLFNEKGDLVYLSPSAHQLTGFTQVDGKQLFEYIHHNDRKPFFSQFKKVLKKPDARTEVHCRIRHKGGHYIWIKGSVTNLVHNEAIEAFVLNCRDVTAQTEMEQAMTSVNRLYASTRQVNRAILTAGDERKFLRALCSIATEHGHFKMAYFSLMDASGNLRLIQSSGVAEADVEPSMVVGGLEQGPFRHVLKTGESFACNDVYNDFDGEYWKYVARQKGFGSFIILPISRLGRTVGVFVLTAPGTGAFKAMEVELLEETASDISFKLDALRKEKMHQTQEVKAPHQQRANWA